MSDRQLKRQIVTLSLAMDGSRVAAKRQLWVDMNSEVKGQTLCLTPNLKGVLKPRQHVTDPCLPLRTLSFSLFLSLLLFVWVSFGTPSLKKQTSFLLLCWEVLTRHLSCNHSSMFDLIAFPVPWNALPGLSSRGREKYLKSLPNILYPNGFRFPCSL